MIDKISLNNFQSHPDTTLELSPGINVITGRSDSGKSAILRALYYIRYHRPLSNNYPSHWIKDKKGNLSGESKITITSQKGTLSKSRTKDSTTYNINGLELSAMGSTLPDQVESFFNLSEVNIQRQFDSHFLLSETPGAVAKFFNDLVHLDEIDLYLSAIDKRKRQTSSELKSLDASIEETERKLKAFDYLDKAEELCATLEAIDQNLEMLSGDEAILGLTLKTFSELSFELTALPDIAELDQMFEELKAISLEEENQTRIFENLSVSLIEYKGVKEDLQKVPDIEKLESLSGKVEITLDELKKVDSDLSIFEVTLDQYNRTEKNLSRIPDIEKIESLSEKASAYSESILEFREQVMSLGDSLEAFEEYSEKGEELSKLIPELESQLPDICPLCGNRREI